MSKTRLTAVVQVILEIKADSVWGGDTTFDQIYKQAEDGVINILVGGNLLLLRDLPNRILSAKTVNVVVKPE